MKLGWSDTLGIHKKSNVFEPMLNFHRCSFLKSKIRDPTGLDQRNDLQNYLFYEQMCIESVLKIDDVWMTLLTLPRMILFRKFIKNGVRKSRLYLSTYFYTREAVSFRCGLKKSYFYVQRQIFGEKNIDCHQ